MNYDIIVVGAGPAGLSAAEYAAKNGVKVLVLERSKEIGYPIHTSGGSWIKELQELGIPERLYHSIYTTDFVLGKHKNDFSYEKPQACILDIRGLYQYLAECAALKGADIVVDATVIEPVIEDNAVKGVEALIHGKKRKLYSKIVIDASGFSSIIANKIGLRKKFHSFGIGAEYELISKNWDQSKVTFILGSRIAPSGYGWIFPTGGNRVRIGTGVIFPNSSKNPTILLDRFLESNDAIIDELKPFSRIEYHRGIVPNVGVVEKTAGNGIITVGDSACQVSGIAGEGIRYAIDIGRMAGKIVNESILKEDYSEKFLSAYDRLWRNKYEKIFKISYELNKRLRNYNDDDWTSKIKYLDKIDPYIFASLLKSDFNKKLILQILKKQPLLFATGTGKLIKKFFKSTKI